MRNFKEEPWNNLTGSINSKLAQDFRRVCLGHSSELTTNLRIARLIRDSKIDISEFYEKNGNSLSDLKIDGIGKTSIKKLEAILSEGVDKADESIIDEKILKMRKETVQALSSKKSNTLNEDPGPSWENGIKVLEK
jgi:hypothetical protein